MTEQDLELFEEYFQLEHQISVNIKNGGPWSTIPDMQTFDASIPTAYKIASEMKGLEQNMLRPLRQLGDAIEPLAEYLKAQSRKIDLMMSYILQAQDEDDLKFNTTSYGGGGFVFVSSHHFDLNNWIECKLFFNEDAAAVYCLGKVVEITPVESELIETETTEETKATETNTDNTLEEQNQTPEKTLSYKVVFHRIRDEDREVVVRASLHQQSKMLLKKARNKAR